jgi:hypothetical protein
MTHQGAAAGTTGGRPRAPRSGVLSQPPAAGADEVTADADGLGVTTAEGDAGERDGLAFGAGVADLVGAADVGLTAAGDGDGDGLAGADDRFGAGATAPCAGLTSR